MRKTLAAAALILLAACVDDAPVAMPDADACGAAALQTLVGQPASVLETMRFGVETRIIRPGMAVTMDYRADRLNIEIDAGEVIARVVCG